MTDIISIRGLGLAKLKHVVPGRVWGDRLCTLDLMTAATRTINYRVRDLLHLNLLHSVIDVSRHDAVRL